MRRRYQLHVLPPWVNIVVSIFGITACLIIMPWWVRLAFVVVIMFALMVAVWIHREHKK